MIQASEHDILSGTLGACLACGASASGIEPDAEQYECECCGAHEVYGLEQLLIMGKLELLD